MKQAKVMGIARGNTKDDVEKKSIKIPPPTINPYNTMSHLKKFNNNLKRLSIDNKNGSSSSLYDYTAKTNVNKQAGKPQSLYNQYTNYKSLD
jgi:hypothetical protein